jgi:hypothetical protein
MYTCGACGGIIEELGEMAVSSGGCICAQEKSEESANSLQQLKAEISAMVLKWKHCVEYNSEWYEVELEDFERLQKLSAVQ